MVQRNRPSDDSVDWPFAIRGKDDTRLRIRSAFARAYWLLVVLPLIAVGGCGSEKTAFDKSLPVELSNSIGMRLRLIEPGEFRMGSPAHDVASDGSEPQHTVRITKPFYIGVFEVTQAEYLEIMEASPSHFCETGVGAAAVANLDTSRFPVDRVTWEEAVEFCGRLSDLSEEVVAARTYRLPTEAEWEYACRAGTDTPYSVGTALTASQANINCKSDGSGDIPLRRTAEVGSYAPNPWGLHDMHGNVWEWCGAGKRKYTSRTVSDPKAAPSFYSIIRGGAWDYPASHCRSDYRREALSGYVYFGFRVVCELE